MVSLSKTNCSAGRQADLSGTPQQGVLEKPRTSRKTKLEKSIKRGKSIIGNLAKRTYSGFAKSEDIQKDIVQMEKALEQMEKDILTKKEFRNNNV